MPYWVQTVEMTSASTDGEPPAAKRFVSQEAYVTKTTAQPQTAEQLKSYSQKTSGFRNYTYRSLRCLLKLEVQSLAWRWYKTINAGSACTCGFVGFSHSQDVQKPWPSTRLVCGISLKIPRCLLLEWHPTTWTRWLQNLTGFSNWHQSNIAHISQTECELSA